VKETYISADFTADYSPYEVEPDALITEDTESAVFYQTLRKVLVGNCISIIGNIGVIKVLIVCWEG